MEMRMFLFIQFFNIENRLIICRIKYLVKLKVFLDVKGNKFYTDVCERIRGMTLFF